MTVSAGSTVEIYTDGGCEPNPGVGGWAAILEYNGFVMKIWGGEPDSTNNRMELTAAIRALESLKRACQVVIHTDSEYVKNGITVWIHGWKQKGWRRGKRGSEIKNLDLWQRLDELACKHQIEWRWVKGHAGDSKNERCDALAADAIRHVANSGKPYAANERRKG